MFSEFHPGRKYREESKSMREYSVPMIANSIAWWINNASDRYVVIYFCGLAENGIYSVASKIPSILNVLQSIFSQAWMLSAVKDFDSEDKNDFFSNTYKVYNCIMVIGCSVIIAADKLLAKFLYAKDFYVSWKYVPWLTIAIVFGSLSGYIGGIFSAVKDSKVFAQSTVIGAVSNVLLNMILTPVIGALGAAIATMVCYMVVWMIRYWHLKRYVSLRINIFRDIASYMVLGIQSVVLLIISDYYMLYGIEVSLCVIIIYLYNKEIMQMLNKS
jgi:O-antigen/teichoic acid export membrane protein